MTGPRRKTTRKIARSTSVNLLVIDNAPLKSEAWRRLQAARKRLARATADLHRHEQTDEPGYRSWMHASHPALITEIRDLMFQVETKRTLIMNVERQARLRGISPAAVWQARKHEQEFVQAMEEEPEEDWGDGDEEEESEASAHERIDEMLDEVLAEQGIDPTSAEAEAMRDMAHAMHRRMPQNEPEPEPEVDDAKEIYRRLVQRLHPDRGGEWTPAREALWHEVQRAWDARDADWLARLEAEYEMSTEILSVESALGRLYQAAREIDGARRDAERKVRGYRQTPAWRFSLRERTPEDTRELAISLRSDRDHLERTLASLEAHIAQWERPLGLSRSRQRERAAEPVPSKGRRKVDQMNLW